MIDVFQIGVRLSMQSNAPEMLSVLLRKMGDLDTSVTSVNRNLKLAGAALAMFAGAAVLKGLWSVIDSHRELNKELEKTKQLGGEFAAAVPQTRANAFAMNRAAPSVDAAEAVKLQREMSLTLGHPVSLGLATEAAKTAIVVSHATGEAVDGMTKNLIRMADLRGQIYSVGADGKEHVDPAKVREEMEAAGRGLILAGPFASSAQLLTMMRQGGAAMKNQTPEAVYALGIEAGVAMGMSKAGTAETSLMQQFIGGTMTKRTAENLTKAGLLRREDWTSGRSGGVVINNEGTKRFEPILSDPVAWLSSGAGADAIKRAAVTDGISVLAEIFRLFGRATTQRFATDALSNAPQFARQRELYGGLPSIQAQYEELRKNDLDLNVQGLSGAWKSFMQALSDAGTPAAITTLHGLTTAVQEFTKLIADHPDAARYMIEFTGALGGFLVLGGAISVVSIALGPFATGLRLLLTAMSGASAAATAAGSLATGIGAVVGAIEAASAGVIGLGWLVKKGSDAETPENEKKLENLRKQMSPGSPTNLPTFDGYDAEGRPVGKGSYSPPPQSAPKALHFTSQTFLDTRKIAETINKYTVDQMQRPAAGYTGPDMRSSAMPSFVGALP